MTEQKLDAETELRNLLSRFDALCAIVRATWYEWRQAAVEYARPGAEPLEIVLKAWEVVGHDTAKAYFPILNKASPTFLEDIAKCIMMSSVSMGEDARIVKSDKPDEIFIQWDHCPWPEFARRYKVPMEEDVLGCDKWFMTVIDDINALFNTNVKLETLKAIPRGDGCCLRVLRIKK